MTRAYTQERKSFSKKTEQASLSACPLEAVLLAEDAVSEASDLVFADDVLEDDLADHE